jgi:hypothetical protein
MEAMSFFVAKEPSKFVYSPQFLFALYESFLGNVWYVFLGLWGMVSASSYDLGGVLWHNFVVNDVLIQILCQRALRKYPVEDSHVDSTRYSRDQK